MNDVHKEIAFEREIEARLVEKGWTQGDRRAFDPKLALDRDQLLGFIEQTQGELWKRLSAQYGERLGDLIVSDLVSMAEARGLLELLRHGLDFRGTTIKLAYFKPSFGLNPELVRKYGQNRLLVYRQVEYEPEREGRERAKSLDMMLALNGLPIATVELKNPATQQTVADAIAQYKNTRDPRAPLFKFKQRALVHFAVDTEEVYMTTRLAWDDTRFLPFNKGNAGAAGNPQNPHGHRTAYLWEEVWARDSFLDIVGRFLHLEKSEDGKREAMIFPRYHQLDVVRRLTAAARRDGPGQNYLVQHSTGSGKSNSIAWLAHRLHSLYREEDGAEKKVFDTVVVVTDRKVLDRQLQQTIWQIDHTPGLVKRIDKDSAQLARALQEGVPIIITTLQKFPFARVTGALDALPERRYAIIADEAHSSQTGETAREMKQGLGAGVKDLELQQYDKLEADAEDEIRHVMESRQQQKNLSFFAFTATPKGKTLKFFGTLGPDGVARPFHLYSMRQAIEERFIFDVLENYTTYATFLKLLKKVDEDPLVDEKQAAKALAHFHRHHAHVIGQKVEQIVDHFRSSVASKIGGRSKAMIVTSSREAAVRYHRAFREHVQEKKYEDLKALVAFSGTVHLEKDDEGYTEEGLNGIKDTELKDKFRESHEHRFLIVADKYQTGYDEPLLHTMYVDKKLADVAAVQTLSRLNRRTSGKHDTFVLDFVNKAEEIQKSFQPFYQATVTEGGADHTHLYRLRHDLEGMQVFTWSEVEAFAKDFYVPRKKVSVKQHGRWSRHVQPAVDRFKEIGREEQEKFRGRLRAYVNLYGYLSQVMGFPARDLEILYGYGRTLLRHLPREEGEVVDLSGAVDLNSLVIDMRHSGAIELVKGEDGHVDAPSGSVGTGATDEKKSPLSEVIDKINERIGARFGGAPEHLLESVIAGLTEDEIVNARALANKESDFQIASDVRSSVTTKMVSHHDENGEFVEAFLNDEEGIKGIVMEAILREAYKRIRERDAAERGIDPVLLADLGKLRNRLEPKLRILVKRSLKMHRGDAWIREVLKILPEQQRKQTEGVDADTILRDHTYLKTLITLIHTKWNEYFKAFEAGSPRTRLTREQVKVLLDYINAHREDAHAGALEEGELATLKIAVTALERAVDRQLED